MIGQTISHYKIIEKLGAGGMGVVYKAQDLKLNRMVALKFLPMEFTSDAEAVNRFINEAQTASALDHANICTIHEIGETAEGRMFICMAYYDGETLRQRVAKGDGRRANSEGRGAAPFAHRSSPFGMTGGLPITETIDIAKQIAAGLQRAHEAGVIHRDIKPENIIITTREEVKIIDFGIAKLAGQSRLTKTGSTLGTMMYMSPEQLHGKAVDHRADIWALGVVLYEMLAGQAPFRGDYEAALVYAIAHESHEPLMRHRPEISAHLQRIVDKALEKNPDARYQSVVEILADLQRLHAATEIPLSTKVLESGRAGNIKPKLPKSKRAFLYGGIAAFLILLIAGALYFFPTRSETIDAIAVLPLANLSGDPNQEYFADGMTEALISVLGQIEALRVISRTSVMQYKGSTKPLPDIARELNVNAVVEGSVQSSGNRVNISVRLISAGTEKRLWSESFERELRDVLTLQREVTLAIAREIKVQVTPNEQARLQQTQEVDPEAYELYLLGRKFREQETAESLQQAVAYFEQALAKDPNFAQAYAELVVPYFLSEAVIRGKRGIDLKTRQAVTKALELDNTIAEAHTALGVIREIYDWDWSGAEEAFRRAIELNPSNREAHGEYGFFLCRTGRMETGLAEMKRAYALDPFSEVANAGVAWAYIWNRQYDEAIEHCQKALTFYPNSALIYRNLGEAYLLKKEYEKAFRAFDTDAMLSGWTIAQLAYLGCAYAFSGNRDKSLAMLDKLQQQQKRGIDATVPIAFIYTGLGETDEALNWLEQAYEEHSVFYPGSIFDPIFDSLHSEPRFQALLKKMGLEIAESEGRREKKMISKQ